MRREDFFLAYMMHAGGEAEITQCLPTSSNVTSPGFDELVQRMVNVNNGDPGHAASLFQSTKGALCCHEACVFPCAVRRVESGHRLLALPPQGLALTRPHSSRGAAAGDPTARRARSASRASSGTASSPGRAARRRCARPSRRKTKPAQQGRRGSQRGRWYSMRVMVCFAPQGYMAMPGNGSGRAHNDECRVNHLQPEMGVAPSSPASSGSACDDKAGKHGTTSSQLDGATKIEGSLGSCECDPSTCENVGGSCTTEHKCCVSDQPCCVTFQVTDGRMVCVDQDARRRLSIDIRIDQDQTDATTLTGTEKHTEQEKHFTCTEDSCGAIYGTCDADQCCHNIYKEHTGDCCDLFTSVVEDVGGTLTCTSSGRRQLSVLFPRPPPAPPPAPPRPPPSPAQPPPKLCSCATYKVSCMCDVVDYVRATRKCPP